MTTIPKLPHLAIVPVENLFLHEEHDDQRTWPLVQRLMDSGMLYNPPIVAAINDGSERYMVLDGANRVTAFWHMGYPHLLVQIVQPDDSELRLNIWSHVLWGISPLELLHNLRAIPDMRLDPASQADQLAWQRERILAWVHLPNRKSHLAHTRSNDLSIHMSITNAIVNAYRHRAKIDRTISNDIDELMKYYDELTALVVYPRIEFSQVVALASQGTLLPAGITRFSISPRALRLNYPLTELKTNKTLEEKNEALHLFIQDRLAIRGVRYYGETTFIFDE